jgi:Arc/MetJ-type ribon-helix-helix transcriptional regulator
MMGDIKMGSAEERLFSIISTNPGALKEEIRKSGYPSPFKILRKLQETGKIFAVQDAQSARLLFHYYPATPNFVQQFAGDGRVSHGKNDPNLIRGKSMKIVTINLPEPFLAALEKLTECGLYPSRSEALRVALRDFLSKELQVAQKLKEIAEDINKEKDESKAMVTPAGEK